MYNILFSILDSSYVYNDLVTYADSLNRTLLYEVPIKRYLGNLTMYQLTVLYLLTNIVYVLLSPILWCYCDIVTHICSPLFTYLYYLIDRLIGFY